jgi:hypothetical protein
VLPDETGAVGKLPGLNGQIRLLVAGAPEDYFSDKQGVFTDPKLDASGNTLEVPDPQYVLEAAGSHWGVQSTLWARARLLELGDSNWARLAYAQMERDKSSLKPYNFEVALRIFKDPLVSQDKFFRTLAFVFHQGLQGQTAADRKKYILEVARSDTDWQDYTRQGLPLTFNQEIIAAGYATIEIDHLKRSLPGYGVELAGQ